MAFSISMRRKAGALSTGLGATMRVAPSSVPRVEAEAIDNLPARMGSSKEVLAPVRSTQRIRECAGTNTVQRESAAPSAAE